MFVFYYYAPSPPPPSPIRLLIIMQKVNKYTESRNSLFVRWVFSQLNGSSIHHCNRCRVKIDKAFPRKGINQSNSVYFPLESCTFIRYGTCRRIRFAMRPSPHGMWCTRTHTERTSFFLLIHKQFYYLRWCNISISPVHRQMIMCWLLTAVLRLWRWLVRLWLNVLNMWKIKPHSRTHTLASLT